MDVVRQDCSTKEEKYDFRTGEHTGWKFVYSEFSYPSKEDRPHGAARASLEIEERYHNEFPSRSNPSIEGCLSDVIYLEFDGRVTRYSDSSGFSPVLSSFCKSSRFKKIRAEEIITEIRKNLSEEARNLFDKGLGGYVEH